MTMTSSSIAEHLIERLKAGHRVVLPGIGTLTIKERAARVARNPRTGEIVNVPSKTVYALSSPKEI